MVGLVFNYRDGGNFYCFSFNDDFVQFIRYENYETVGKIMQGVKWSETRRSDMETLISDRQTLTFKIDGVRMMNIRHMPLSYNGFGFYTFGNQELVVDEIEFRQ